MGDLHVTCINDMNTAITTGNPQGMLHFQHAIGIVILKIQCLPLLDLPHHGHRRPRTGEVVDRFVRVGVREGLRHRRGGPHYVRLDRARCPLEKLDVQGLAHLLELGDDLLELRTCGRVMCPGRFDYWSQLRGAGVGDGGSEVLLHNGVLHLPLLDDLELLTILVVLDLHKLFELVERQSAREHFPNADGVRVYIHLEREFLRVHVENLRGHPPPRVEKAGRGLEHASGEAKVGHLGDDRFHLAPLAVLSKSKPQEDVGAP
mmetsp:Transcript_21924/g.61624  ORF Transcript_21924/g.61624 Transcript_21924/m.61624 type:complete len:261 (-) Transcript_21924:3118-3900(-)